MKIKVDSFDSLPIGETLTFHNVIILINSILNKYQIHYYYILSEILLSISEK